MGPGGGGGSLAVNVSSGPTAVRQGDVVTFGATVTGEGAATATVDWSIEPSTAGRIENDGGFVAYEPGTAVVVAQVGMTRGERSIEIIPRGVPTGTFTVVGQGAISDRFTSDLWLNGTFGYTGTWSTRNGPAGLLQGNTLYAWDISNPANPVLTDSVTVDAGTVNDVKIRPDAAFAVLSHEGSADFQNGVSFLDLTDPLHPTVTARITGTMEQGVHNLWIDGDFVYAVVDGSNASGGLRVIDASDPSAPQIVSSFYGGNPSFNFGQFLHDVYVRDGLAFLSHWDPGLIVLDVGNGMAGGTPQNPVEVGRVQTAGGDTHNAWYWPDRQIVFVGEEDFSTPGVMHVVDFSEPANPVEVATFSVPETTPHNFWLDEENEILYAGWYEEGLWAIDVSGELRGRLDRQGRVIANSLYAGRGACQTGGTCTWAPQLHEGLIWVSDINSGLWALRLDF